MPFISTFGGGSAGARGFGRGGAINLLSLWVEIRDTLAAQPEWTLLDDNTIETDYNTLRNTSLQSTGINGIPSSQIGGIGGGFFDIPWYQALNGLVTFEIHGAQGGRGIRSGNVGYGGPGGVTIGTLSLGNTDYIRLIIGGGGEGDEGNDNVPGGGGGQSCIIVPGFGSNWNQRIVVSGGGGGGGAGTTFSATGGAGGGANLNGDEGAGNGSGFSQWGSGGGVDGNPIGGSQVKYHGEFGYAQNGDNGGPSGHPQDRAFGGGGLGTLFESGGGGGGWYGGGVANYGNYGGSGGGGAGFANSQYFSIFTASRNGSTNTDQARALSGYMKITFTG